MDTRLALMTGCDYPIPECQLTLHQPTIKEIGLIGENDFFTGSQCLSIYKSMFVTEDKSALDDINNFQIFMTVMRDKESMEKKHSVLQVLTLFFPKYDKVLFTPQSLLFQGKEGNVVIDENNFDGSETFGLLCYAEISTFGEIDSEIEKIVMLDDLPDNWTYPNIQPYLIKEILNRKHI